MLDYKRAFYDNFRMLAEKLGMDRDDIRWLEQQNHPTDKILNAMKRTLTVGRLIDVLRELEREGVASELEAWVDSWAEDYINSFYPRCAAAVASEGSVLGHLAELRSLDILTVSLLCH